MKNLSFKGLIIAFVVSTILAAIFGLLSVVLFLENFNDATVEAFEKQTSFLVFMTIVGLLLSVLGGYISARYGKEEPYKNAIAYGVITITLGIFVAEYDPLWVDVVAYVTAIPLALLGGHLFKINNDNKINIENSIAKEKAQ
ncbi:hypothetical protein HC752_09325 [Vibrio sp. S9_S30]|uniref:hypothetical protein n=1 Tax=Vibrio sp. S9_S30 TaxID=2720226 RepID=UPI001681A425|nr:hypothetical protein [Vibrio sp. S9_S30]MBD1557140.1 hypothetical protein [Vibrio sp. S9_S30]